MIGGLFFTIAPLVLTIAKDVIGLDISIKQFEALPPPVVAAAAPPVRPLCPAMLGTATEDELNRIELSRVTGACRWQTW